MRKLIAALCAVAVFATPAAFAFSHFVKISPNTVTAGKTVRVSGTVGMGCGGTDQVIVLSRAFKGSTTHEFASVPALFLRQDAHHNFSAQVTIKKSIRAGTYTVGGRCGGGNFGGTILKVTKP